MTTSSTAGTTTINTTTTTTTTTTTPTTPTTAITEPSPLLPASHVLPPLILGGAGFSYQLTPNPSEEQAREVLSYALQSGIRAIDTSPYYEPSEKLLGAALSHPDITTRYRREDYILLTKVGRINATRFDYRPDWIRQSIARSLRRLRTTYLDVVFCHDIEFVPEDDVLVALGVLLEFVAAGTIRYIGISGYRIDILTRVARRARSRYGRPLDVVQNWAQMTLQNDRLEREGLHIFREAGVSCVCSSSPLAIGLLRDGGVPIAALGDFHPAPVELRKAAQAAAEYVAGQGQSLASLAFRYALRRAQGVSTPEFRVSTIMGGSSVAEIKDNITAALQVLRCKEQRERVREEEKKLPVRKGGWQWMAMDAGSNSSRFGMTGSAEQLQRDQRLCEEVQRILGEWMNYSFSVPGDDWDIKTGQPVVKPKL